MIQKIFHSIYNALKGLKAGASVDTSIRIELSLGLAVFILLACLFWPLKGVELLLLILAYLLILITEYINTAVETMLDRLHPIRNKMIGMSKDIAAAAVLLSYLFAGAMVIVFTLIRMGILE